MLDMKYNSRYGFNQNSLICDNGVTVTGAIHFLITG